MRTKFSYPVIGLLVGALVWFSFSLGLFSGLENFFEDLLFSSKQINSDLVIVAIDNDSLSKIGQWPWPRKIFGEAILKLNEAAPRALGIDVVFSEPSRVDSLDDSFFSDALGKISYPVILPVEATSFTSGKNMPIQAVNFIKPLPIFKNQNNVTLGHVNLIADRDGVVRKFPVSIAAEDKEGIKTYKALAYEVLKKSGKGIIDEENLKGIERIVYAAPPGSIRRIPFWRLLEADMSRQLKDKIVFIGATAADLHDSKLVTFGKEKEMAGVEIQANIANMLLSGYRLTPLNKTISSLSIFLAAFISSLVFIFFRRPFTPLILNAVLGLAYFIGIIIFFQNGTAINILHINFAWALPTASLFGYRYLVGEREKRALKNIFSKYVSKEVVNEILRNSEKVVLGGEEKEITVLFSDIRAFTTFAEKNLPKKTVEILNGYFSLMTEEVLKNGGMLDKYIGDAVMAFWGAPISDPDQAEKAFKAALGMIEQLKSFNKKLKEAGEQTIDIGIGIYSGPAIVGNVGSESRLNYTAIGDTVNIASRLEELTKEYKTKLIIGESVKNKIKGDYKFKDLGETAIRGKNKTVKIYALEI